MIAAFALAVLTYLTFLQIRKQTPAIQKSADAAKSAAATAASQFEAGERPWITLDARIAGPLTFNEQGATFTFDITVKNIGHSPAFNLNLVPVVNIQSAAYGISPIDRLAKICRDVERGNPTVTPVLFPGDQPNTRRWFTGLTPNELTDAAKASNTRFPSTRPSMSTYLVICVGYQSGINRSARYSTGKIYDVGRIDPTNPSEMLALFNGEGLAANSMRIEEDPIFGAFAK